MKLVYDVASVPKGLDFGNLTKIYEQHHVVFWDSAKGGTKPKLYQDEGDVEAKLLVVDLHGQEIDIETYAKKFREDEYWEKEVFNAKNSPIYFFKNYGTTVWPVSNEDVRDYLLSLGLQDITAKDSETATELWEKQKEQTKLAMEFITRELLEERKAVLDSLKAVYEVEIKRLENKLKVKVELFDPKTQQPLEDRKRIANLVDKIKLQAIPSKYGNYRNKKGKWDLPMLFNTEYSFLLTILEEAIAPNLIIAK